MAPGCLPSLFSFNRRRAPSPELVKQEIKPNFPPAYVEKEHTPPSIINKTFEKYDTDLRDISLELHGYHELGFKEYKSAKLLSDFLEKEGFSLKRGIAGDETAFVATFTQGKKGPVVSFNAVVTIFDGFDIRNMTHYLVSDKLVVTI
jgi:hypothetical protein